MNSHEFDPNSRKVFLISYLFSLAADICPTIQADFLAAEVGTSLINDAVHKKDALSVVRDIYAQLQISLESLFVTPRASVRLNPGATPNSIA